MLCRPRHCSKGVQPVHKAVYRAVAVVINSTARGEIGTCAPSHCSQACAMRLLRPPEARGCEQLAYGCYSTVPRLGIELAVIELQVQHPNH